MIAPHRDEQLCAEDFPVERRFELGSRALSAEEIKAFAREWDPQLFHVDEEAAARSPMGGLVASGLQTLAVFVRLLNDAILHRTAVVAGRGFREMRLLTPVRPGMALTGAATVVDQRPAGPDAAVVEMRGELCDEHGQAAMTLEFELAVSSVARAPEIN